MRSRVSWFGSAIVGMVVINHQVRAQDTIRPSRPPHRSMDLGEIDRNPSLYEIVKGPIEHQLPAGMVPVKVDSNAVFLTRCNALYCSATARKVEIVAKTKVGDTVYVGQSAGYNWHLAAVAVPGGFITGYTQVNHYHGHLTFNLSQF